MVAVGLAVLKWCYVQMSVQVGDRVVFGKYSGTEIDDELLLISESDLLAVEEA